MERSSANPLLVAAFFLIRCLVPLLIMLAVSYLLRRLGLIKDTPVPPDHRADANREISTEEDDASKHGNGGLAHDSV
jgi:hypothetical protein